MARTSTARQGDLGPGQTVTATFTDPDVVPHRTTLGRYERGREGTGPYPVVLAGLLTLVGENGGRPAFESDQDLSAWLAEARERVGLTLTDLEGALEERVRAHTLRLEGTVVAVDTKGGRLWLEPDGLPAGPVPVELATVELEVVEPETAAAPEPFSSRKAERVTHRRVMAENFGGAGSRYARVEDGWMLSTSRRITARTRTERPDGVYTIDGRDVERVEAEGGDTWPEVLEAGEGALGRLRLEAPLDELQRAERAAHDDAHRPGLAQVLFEVEEDGRTVRIVGCDGHRLAWNTRRSAAPIEPGRYGVPQKAMAVFGREKKAPVAEIRFDEEKVTLDNGNTVVVARPTGQAYPDWKGVLPESLGRVVRLEREAFWSTLRDLEGAARETHNNRVAFGETDGLAFELMAGDGEAEVRAELAYRPARAGRLRPDSGTLQMPLRMLDREAEFACNLVYLKDVLRGIAPPHVFLGYNTPDKAFVFHGRPPVLAG